MKLNKILFMGLFLILIFTIGAVSAGENATEEIDISEDNDNLEAVEIELEPKDDFEIGMDQTIDITIPYGTSGSLSVNVDGKAAGLKYNEDEDWIEVYTSGSSPKSLSLPFDDDIDDEDPDDYEYSITLDTLTPGKIYNVEVIFNVDGSQPISKSSKITLHNPGQEVEDDDMVVEIDAEDVYIYSKEGNMIYITASSNVINDLDIKINGVSYSYKKSSSTEAYVDISDLELGEYTIVVTYNNGKNSTEESFEVVNSIDAPEEMTYGDSKEVILTLASDAKGSLKVTIDGKEIGNVKLVNGVAKVQIPALSVGIHYIMAQYVGDDYIIDEIDDEIEVLPKITIPSKMTAGEKKFLTIEIGNTTGTVEITAEGDKYKTLEISGSAKISLADLDDGEVTIGVVFIGSEGMLYFDEDYEIMVNSVAPRLAGPSSVQVVYTKSGQYKLKAYGTNNKLAKKGEWVEFMIGNNRHYDVYTDKNGVATLKMPADLAPGKYTIYASYDGASFKANLVVKHLLKLKKVKKVKRSAKKIVLKATVKNVKNKKVVFKFNKKKYTANTNKKGVAKVVIKKNVLKKLKKGKKVTYQATYLKDTVKRTVKVKK